MFSVEVPPHGGTVPMSVFGLGAGLVQLLSLKLKRCVK